MANQVTQEKATRSLSLDGWAVAIALLLAAAREAGRAKACGMVTHSKIDWRISNGKYYSRTQSRTNSTSAQVSGHAARHWPLDHRGIGGKGPGEIHQLLTARPIIWWFPTLNMFCGRS